MTYMEFIPAHPAFVPAQQKAEPKPALRNAPEELPSAATAVGIFDALADFPSDFMANGRRNALPIKRGSIE